MVGQPMVLAAIVDWPMNDSQAPALHGQGPFWTQGKTLWTKVGREEKGWQMFFGQRLAAHARAAWDNSVNV